MRSFRVLVACACASSAMGCTLYLLTSDLYDGLGVDADIDVFDSAPSDAVSTDAPVSAFVVIGTGITAITTYNNQLYTNDTQGIVSTCASPCTSLTQLVVAAGAVSGNYRGLAVNSTGVYWSVSNGIWIAGLDGGNPNESILDPNVPQVLAADGQRVSWTTRDDGGTLAVIHSCAIARFMCHFNIIAGKADGGALGSGEGGLTELVDSTGNVDNGELAAGPGYVAWVKNGGQVEYTFVVDGGTTTPGSPQNDPFMNGQPSGSTHVTNEGSNVFFSYSDPADNLFVVRQVAIPNAADAAAVYHSSAVNKNPCMAAGAGRIVFGDSRSVSLVDEANGNVTLKLDGPDGGTGNQLAVAVTSTDVFLLTRDLTLWRATRTD